MLQRLTKTDLSEFMKDTLGQPWAVSQAQGRRKTHPIFILFFSIFQTLGLR